MRIFFSLQTCFMLNLLTSSSICSIFPQISRNQQSCCLGVSFPRRRSSGFVTRDEPLRKSAWEATSGFHCWVVVQSTIGSLSKDDDDGSENVAKKIKLRSFKLNRVYLDPLNMSSAGDFSWSWITQDFIQVQKEEGKFVVCPRPP